MRKSVFFLLFLVFSLFLFPFDFFQVQSSPNPPLTSVSDPHVVIHRNWKPVPQKLVFHVETEGTFTISNTTEERELLETPIWGSAIGATWNITLLLGSNSSSGLNVTFFSFMLEWWEGKRNFTINPTDFRSEIYIQHGMSDEPPLFNFKYHLLNTTKQASGEYIINQTFSGYDSGFSTGSIYISNITAWLEQMKTTSSPPSLWDILFLPSNVVFGGVVLILISISFYFRFRKGKKI